MVRFAETPDLPEVCTIRRQVHQVHVDGRPDIYRMPEHTEEFDASLYETLEKENYRLIVYEQDSSITGYALIRLVTIQNLCMKQDRYTYFIDEFGVDKNCRRQGIGTALMRAIQEYANEDGAASVELDVWAFNDSAEQFYRSLGMTTKHTFLELPL